MESAPNLGPPLSNMGGDNPSMAEDEMRMRANALRNSFRGRFEENYKPACEYSN